jgi:serine/threonine protein phosphatase PrpC
LLLACDGIYDVMSNGEIVEFVRWRMKNTDDLCAITNDIVDACLSKVGTKDFSKTKKL